MFPRPRMALLLLFATSFPAAAALASPPRSAFADPTAMAPAPAKPDISGLDHPLRGGDGALEKTGSATTAVEQRHDVAASRPLVRRSAPSSDPRGSAVQRSVTGTSWIRTLGSLAAVVALIILLSWGYRAVIGIAHPRRVRNPGVIEVLGRAAIAPRQSICLVRVGPRLIVVGMTPQKLTALDVITDPDLTARLLGEAAARRRDSHSAEFNSVLETEAHAYEAPGQPPPTAAEPADAVHEALRRLRAHARMRLPT